ncbi:hypothetical protein [Orbus hercynius]|nr:hypothetical protein [Orbus hercynius]
MATANSGLSISPETGQGYLPKPKRIKHFYDTGYHDIVTQLVAEHSIS